MSMKRVLLSFLLFIFSTLMAFEAYEGQKVEKIQITFEDHSLEDQQDPKRVLSKIKTKEGQPFSQLTFDKDLKTLSESYDQIVPAISVENNHVVIHLKIWPRPTIHSIQWFGNEKVKTSKLQGELNIEPNTVFNREEFNEKFNNLKEYYIKKGYYEAQLNYTIYPIEGTNLVDIDVNIEEGRSGKIRNISFEGFTSDEESDLKEMIHTKKYNFLLSWLMGTGMYNEEAVEQDKITILHYLHNKGYADARIDIEIKDDPKKDAIILEIRVERGKLYRIGNVQYEGNKLIENENLSKKILIKDGDAFSPDKVRETAQGIQDAYGQKGYIETNVQYETHLRPDSDIYDIDYYIEEGDQFRVGLIHVFGNSNTKNNVILRESLLVPGEVFDSRKLKATQQRLQNIGYFKSVNVYAVRTPEAEEEETQKLNSSYRDVYIEVDEASTGNASIFLGFSSLDDVFGGLDLTEHNFNIKGIPQIFTGNFSDLRGAGEYAHAKANIGARQQNYIISWLDPYFRDTLWRLGFDLSYTTSRLQTEDYNIHTFGLTTTTSYPITNYWTYGAKYRIRNTRSDVQSKAGTEAEELGKKHGIISGIGSNFRFDSTDSSIRPHRGLRSNIEGELIGLGGPFRFVKLNWTNTLYVYMWSKGTLKFRTDFKFIFPYGGNTSSDVPFSERLMLGGVGSVRGYKPYVIGPQSNSRTEDPVPLGGISSGLFSAEYNQEIFKMLDAFVFFDAGSVRDKEFSIPLNEVRAAYGLGLRIELMNRTPIMIGYGWPFNAKSSDDKEQFFFSMGGQF